MPSHRKRVRHYHEPGDLHELTFSCYRRMPLLTNDNRLALLAQSIRRALDRYQLHLVAYVFMPEHVHLLVVPPEPETALPDFLKAIKRPFSFRVKQSLLAEKSPLLDKLTVRERPGRICFRF